LGLPQNARALGPAGLRIAVRKTSTKIEAFTRNFSHAWESPNTHAESPEESLKPNAGGNSLKKIHGHNWPRGHLADMWIFADMACSFEFDCDHA